MEENTCEENEQDLRVLTLFVEKVILPLLLFVTACISLSDHGVMECDDTL